MRWEELTALEFAQAVKDTQTCILSLGVVEKHGDHLPLGTDYLNGLAVCSLAAEQEPAVVFPPYYFGQIYEAQCFPGTITISPTLLLELTQQVLDEIGRNGFRKIILYNAHGGNGYFLNFLAQCHLAKERPYSLYAYQASITASHTDEYNHIVESEVHGHGCECETSITMANRPDLVKMDRVTEPAFPLGRSSHLPNNFTGIRWYSDYPQHYAGDASYASREKGEALVKLQVAGLARYIRAVKEDEVTPNLEREFFARAKQLEK